jgi:nucleoside-diphosphate-sugar epimerase
MRHVRERVRAHRADIMDKQSVLKVLKRVAAASQRPPIRELRLNETERGRVGSSEVQELRVDFAKLEALAGWRPRHSWEEGVRRTIRWYAENRERWHGGIDWR